MKAGAHKIEVEAQLILTTRELELLNHIAAYDHAEIAAKAESRSYANGVTKEEVSAFFKLLQSETASLMRMIEVHRKVLFSTPH